MSYKRGFAECFLSILLASPGIKPPPFSVRFQKTDYNITVSIVNSTQLYKQGFVVLHSGAPRQGIPHHPQVYCLSNVTQCAATLAASSNRCLAMSAPQ